MRKSSRSASDTSVKHRLKRQAVQPADPQEAADAFHELLHEYDPENHRTFFVEDDQGNRFDGYSLAFDLDAVSTSIRRRLVVEEVTVTFDVQCQVVYTYTPINEDNVTHVEYFAEIEYDDPNLLANVFRAIAKLGVYVPTNLKSSIRQAQQSLSCPFKQRAALSD